jgi:hypothetical protein
MTPDPGHVGASVEDPQSWNASVYGRNDPVNLVDPTGRTYRIYSWNGGCANAFELSDDEFDRFVTENRYDFEGNTLSYYGDPIYYFFRTAIDDNDRASELIDEMAKRTNGSNQMIAVGAGVSVAAGVVGGVAAATGAGTVVIDGVVYSYTQLARLGHAALLQLVTAGKLTMQVYNQIRAQFGPLLTEAGDYLFARNGQGLLNGRVTGDLIRLGYGWQGTARTGQDVFRFVIGSERTYVWGYKIHFHVFSIPIKR